MFWVKNEATDIVISEKDDQSWNNFHLSNEGGHAIF